MGGRGRKRGGWRDGVGQEGQAVGPDSGSTPTRERMAYKHYTNGELYTPSDFSSCTGEQ